MCNNQLLNPSKLPTSHQRNRSRISIPIIPENTNDIDLSQRRRANRKRLNGISHTDLRQHATRGGGVDTRLHAGGDAGAIVDAGETVLHAVCFFQACSVALGVLQRVRDLLSVRCIAGRGWVVRIRLGDKVRLQPQIQRFGNLQPRRVNIRNDNGGEVLRSSQRTGQKQTDSTRPENQRRRSLAQLLRELNLLPRRRMRAPNRMQTNRQRLHKRTTGIRNIFRQLMTHLRRMVGELHQRPVEMRKHLCAASELHLGADVVPACAAEDALPAGKADFQRDTVAYLERGDVGAEGCDCAGGFVAEAHGFADDEVAIAAVGVVVEVGAAEAGCADGDLDFCAGGRGEVSGFLFFVRVSLCLILLGCRTMRRSLAPWRTSAFVVDCVTVILI